VACDYVAAPAGFHWIDWMIPSGNQDDAELVRAAGAAQSVHHRHIGMLREPLDRLSRPVLFPNAPRKRLVLNSKPGSSNGRDIACPSPHCSGSDAAPVIPARADMGDWPLAVTQATAERMRADHHARKSLVNLLRGERRTLGLEADTLRPGASYPAGAASKRGRLPGRRCGAVAMTHVRTAARTASAIGAGVATHH
jgi:hypothetical protein